MWSTKAGGPRWRAAAATLPKAGQRQVALGDGVGAVGPFATSLSLLLFHVIVFYDAVLSDVEFDHYVF